jgi:hypothetical protein
VTQPRLFPDIPTAAEHSDQLRDREADYTPRLVVRAILDAAMPRLLNHLLPFERDAGYPAREVRILDWCAGAGVWSDEVRGWLRRRFQACGQPPIPVEITAVEIEPTERVHLERVADVVRICDWRELAGTYDLVVGNPPFKSCFHAGVQRMIGGEPSQGPRARSMLAYQSIASLQRGSVGRAIARRYPPAIQFDVPGGVKHRSGINPKTGDPWTQDERSYCAFLWCDGMMARSTGWPRVLLPELPSSARSWTRRPGTEWQTGGEP